VRQPGRGDHEARRPTHRFKSAGVASLATKRSPHTRAAYLRDLAQWAGWLARHGVPLLEADETAAAMRGPAPGGRGVKDSTAARKLTAVSVRGVRTWSRASAIPNKVP
jgi:site-specific recombinase XerD